jgi:hypothetical protein
LFSKRVTNVVAAKLADVKGEAAAKLALGDTAPEISKLLLSASSPNHYHRIQTLKNVCNFGRIEIQTTAKVVGKREN